MNVSYRLKKYCIILDRHVAEAYFVTINITQGEWKHFPPISQRTQLGKY